MKDLDFILEPEKKIPVTARTQVIIVGGGPAGVVAAIASARNGAETLLIEKFGFLGGNATAALVNPIFVFHNSDGEQIIKGIAQEIIDRLIPLGGCVGHVEDICGDNPTMTPFDPEVMKYVLLEMAEESGVKLLLHSFFSDCIVRDSKIQAIIIENKSGRQSIEGKIYIDATGDGDVAYKAGVPYKKGRDGDGLTQPMTLMFKMGGIDLDRVKYFMDTYRDLIQLTADSDKLKKAKAITLLGLEKIIEEDRTVGEFPIPRARILLYSLPRGNEVIVNVTRIINADGTNVNDLTRGEIEGRKQARIVADFLKKHIWGFESSYILETPTQVGVRETRRILGEYILTEEDIAEERVFYDGIAKGCFAIDIHGPNDSGQIFTGSGKRTYNIPYRCLVPKGIDNLLVSGRCISTSHEALASVRVMATCMAMGQAAGTAAALSIINEVSPKKLDISLLQKTLRDQNVVI